MCFSRRSPVSHERNLSLIASPTWATNMYQVRMYEGLSAVVENVWFDGKMTTFGSSTVDPKSVTEGEFWTIVFQRAYLQHFESIQTDPTTGKQHRISFRNAADVATTGFAVSLFKGEHGHSRQQSFFCGHLGVVCHHGDEDPETV